MACTKQRLFGGLLLTAIIVISLAVFFKDTISSEPYTFNFTTPRKVRASWPPHIRYIRPGQCETNVSKAYQSTGFFDRKLPYCSAQEYKKATKKIGYFPGKGTWLLTKYGYKFDAFVPEHCNIKMGYITPQRGLSLIKNTLLKHQMKHIVLMGDSNGAKTFMAMLESA